MNWIEIVSYTALLSSMFPLIMGLVRRKHFNDINKTAFYVVLCFFIADWSSFFTAYWWGFNWYMFPITTVFCAIPIFFYFIQVMSKNWKTPLQLGLVFLILIQVSESLIFRDINDFNGVTATYLSLFIGITAIFGMIHIKRNTTDILITPGKTYINIFDHPSFWFMLGLVVYYGANVVNNAFGNLLIQYDVSKFYSTNGLSAVTLIVYRALFTIGLFKVPTASPSLES